jgi:hypothetical protein
MEESNRESYRSRFSDAIKNSLEDFRYRTGLLEPVPIEDAEAFRNRRRRELSKLLVKNDDSLIGSPEPSSVELGEATDLIAAQENGCNPGKAPREERKAVYVALYQSAVPYFEENGWASYDDETRVISPEPELLEKVPEMRDVERFLEGKTKENNTDLGPDEFYDTLSNLRRRKALEYLKAGDSDLSEVSEVVSAVEHGKTRRELSSQERKKVLISMHQFHLPKMDDYDVVEYDQSTRKTVEQGENFDTVVRYVDEDLEMEESVGARYRLTQFPGYGGRIL